jgi:nitroimidazol reductase NimA-like FMN-containing flavoprotein (pyridoxamine 5'-phosphate oxidase superfamily)
MFLILPQGLCTRKYGNLLKGEISVLGITNVRQNSRICLEVDWHGRWLPAKTALAFSVEYTGVVVFGRAHLLEDSAEKERALQGLLDKYFPDLKPGVDYRPITPEELAKTAVFAVEIEAWSGKRKVAP